MSALHRRSILDRLESDHHERPCPRGGNIVTHCDREEARSLIRDTALGLARLVPPSRELNHSLNKLDEALFWAHAAIDRWPRLREPMHRDDRDEPDDHHQRGID
jgi:hypothetical protein